jgi:hypothetical protein
MLGSHWGTSTQISLVPTSTSKPCFLIHPVTMYAFLNLYNNQSSEAVKFECTQPFVHPLGSLASNNNRVVEFHQQTALHCS